MIFEKPLPRYLKEKIGAGSQGGDVSPMPGVVEKLCVEEGQTVKTGDPLVVIIAMKMEVSLPKYYHYSCQIDATVLLEAYKLTTVKILRHVVYYIFF